jgi:hypothetical protein
MVIFIGPPILFLLLFLSRTPIICCIFFMFIIVIGGTQGATTGAGDVAREVLGGGVVGSTEDARGAVVGGKLLDVGRSEGGKPMGIKAMGGKTNVVGGRIDDDDDGCKLNSTGGNTTFCFCGSVTGLS